MPIPLVIWGGVALGTAIAGWLAKDKLKNLFSKDENKLGIIGMQASGKTRFLSFLRDVEYVEKNTSKEKYESFTYTTPSGKKILISEGTDIGGGNMYREMYENIISESDVIFYFFDIHKYLNDTQYMRECNSRFHSVAELLCQSEEIELKLTKDFEKVLKDKKKKIVFFATHKDQVGIDNEKLVEEFKTKLSSKIYRDLVDYTFPMDTRNKEELSKLTDEIFK